MHLAPELDPRLCRSGAGALDEGIRLSGKVGGRERSAHGANEHVALAVLAVMPEPASSRLALAAASTVLLGGSNSRRGEGHPEAAMIEWICVIRSGGKSLVRGDEGWRSRRGEGGNRRSQHVGGSRCRGASLLGGRGDLVGLSTADACDPRTCGGATHIRWLTETNTSSSSSNMRTRVVRHHCWKHPFISRIFPSWY